MAVDKSLVSGSTTMLVLKLLEEKDMYGYEMFYPQLGACQKIYGIVLEPPRRGQVSP